MSSPEQLVDAGVSVADGEPVQRGGGRHVLVDGDPLLVGTKHGRVVVGIGHAQFHASHVHVRRVRIRDVYCQVECRTRQRVEVHRLCA